MKNLIENIKTVFRYWLNIFGLIFSGLFEIGREKILELLLLILSWFIFIVASGKVIDTLVIQGYVSDLEGWVRTSYAIGFVTFVYGFILLIYYPAKIDSDKQKIINDLSPEEPNVIVSFETFSPMKGVQTINIINCSESNMKCRASLGYIAPMLLPNKFPQHYPIGWYSKRLVWGSQKCPDGNVIIDKNHGRATIEFAKVFDTNYKFLFQDGDRVQEGFDGIPPEHALGEGVHLVQFRLDGEINKKEFTIKKEYLILFKMEKVDEKEGKDILLPTFQFQEAFTNSGGV